MMEINLEIPDQNIDTEGESHGRRLPTGLLYTCSQ